MTQQQKARSIESLIFITEKRDGHIKARTCGNGSKQCQWMTKADTSSPTVSMQSVLITFAIEVHKNQEVAIIDIPNAVVQMPHEGETVFMKVQGELANILLETCPELYKDYVVYENRTPVLYLELLKALYGLLGSSLLFY